MANGLSLQELHVWPAGSRNVNNGTLVAINSSALFDIILEPLIKVLAQVAKSGLAVINGRKSIGASSPRSDSVYILFW